MNVNNWIFIILECRIVVTTSDIKLKIYYTI